MKTKTTTFEELLRELHAADYTGQDDDMEDDFDGWICDLDGEELIEFGEQFGRIARAEGFAEAKTLIFNTFK